MHIQAAYCGLKSDFEWRDMEDSMTHHRDPNVPQDLNARAISDFEEDEEIIKINQRIAELTEQIRRQPSLHEGLAAERSQLYSKKAKRKQEKKHEYISSWCNAIYDVYNNGNEIDEQDRTCLFNIYSKYMPKMARLKENLFTEASIDSEIGRQCLEDMVALCTSTDKIAYYPEMAPVDG